MTQDIIPLIWDIEQNQNPDELKQIFRFFMFL